MPIVFQDPKFKAAVEATLGKPSGSDLFAEDLAKITHLNVNGKGISSMAELQYFTSLTNLYCQSNNLSKLDVGNNTQLTRLECNGNRLTELDVSKNTMLTILYCSENLLKELDVSKNTMLTTLVIHTNNLSTIDVSNNTALAYLACYSNNLSILDVRKNTKLATLYCGVNPLTKLAFTHSGKECSVEASGNGYIVFTGSNIIGAGEKAATAVLGTNALSNSWTLSDRQVAAGLGIRYTITGNGITYGNISGTKLVANFVTSNMPIVFQDPKFKAAVEAALGKPPGSNLFAEDLAKITHLNVNGKGISSMAELQYFTSLTNLYCQSNNLSKLDVGNNTKLTRLECSGNRLTELDVSKNTKLTILYCFDNLLKELDVSKNTMLTTLVIHTNKLSTIDVSNNTALAYLACYSNNLSILDVRRNTKLATLYCGVNPLTKLAFTHSGKECSVEASGNGYIVFTGSNIISEGEKAATAMPGTSAFINSWTLSDRQVAAGQDIRYRITGNGITCGNISGTKLVANFITLGSDSLKGKMDNFALDMLRGGRLLISPEEIESLKSDVRPGGARYKQYQMLIKSLNLGNPPPYTEPSGSEQLYQQPVGNNTANLLMAYLLSGDVTYRDKAIQWAMASVNYPTWGSDGAADANLAAGFQMLSVSLVYNWLKDDGLTPGQCNSIRARLTAACKATYTLAYKAKNSVGWWWGNAYLANHMWVTMSGQLFAAMALYPEAADGADKAEIIKWIDLILYNFETAFEHLPPDGTSQEGPSYWEGGCEYLLKASLLLRNNLGIDTISGNKWYSNNANYVLYTMLPRNYWTRLSNRFNYGDCPTNAWFGPSHLLRVFAAEYQDETAQWLAARIEDADVDVLTSPWMAILWMDPTLGEKSPAQSGRPTLFHFDDLGIAVSRTDWSGAETALFFKCGPYMGKGAVLANNSPENWAGGHPHPDANSFMLYANGEFLLKDDGNAYKSSSYHSTLLVENSQGIMSGQMGGEGAWFNHSEPQSVKALPEISVAQSTAKYDYLVGKGAEAYSAALGLEKFNRNLLYLKDENVLIVLDDIKLTAAKKLELHFMINSTDCKWQNGAVSVNGSRNNMKITPLTNNGVSSTFEMVPMRKTDGSSMASQPAIIQRYSGSVWQNATAISWSEKTKSPKDVTCVQEGNVFKFRVEGSNTVYIIDLTTNTVTTTS